jgi:hypothetical protein
MKNHGSNTVFFVGDSITSHFLSDAMCSTRRAGLFINRFENAKEQYGVRDGFQLVFEKDEKPEHAVFQVFFLEFTNDWDTPLSSVKDTAKRLMEKKELVSGKALFIANVGVHYMGRPRDMYTPLIKSFINVFLEFIADGHTVIFRESSAQHFHTPTGEFTGSILENPSVPEGKKEVSWVSLLGEKAGVRSTPGNSEQESRIIIEAENKQGMSFRCAPIANEAALDDQNWQNKILYETLKG